MSGPRIFTVRLGAWGNSGKIAGETDLAIVAIVFTSTPPAPKPPANILEGVAFHSVTSAILRAEGLIIADPLH